jgi:hypothetical protein
MAIKFIYANGQMCNQLFVYSQYLPESRDAYKIALLFPKFKIQLFDKLDKSIVIPFYPKWILRKRSYSTYKKIVDRIFDNYFIIRFFGIIVSVIPGVELVISDVSSCRSLPSQKSVKLFEPNVETMNRVNQIFENKKSKNAVLIGIHIRRGDYRNFRGGEFFYSIEDYYQIMLGIDKLFENVVFFISSNEDFDVNVFNDIKCFRIKNATQIEDMAGLSICDYICGPPSTFSAWSSLYNNVPVYFVKNLNDEIRLDSFKKYCPDMLKLS